MSFFSTFEKKSYEASVSTRYITDTLNSRL